MMYQPQIYRFIDANLDLEGWLVVDSVSRGWHLAERGFLWM